MTLAAGYLARPLGGVIFGHYGDRLGRKKMLLITLVIMGSVSALIGLLPTYATIGVWHPSCWWCCASSRAWPWAANGPARH